MRVQDRNYCRGDTLYSVRDALGVARFLPALKEVSAIFLISGINLHCYKIHLKYAYYIRVEKCIAALF